MDKSSRIGYLDFLKVIGLTGIVIAHVNPPDWLFMLRSFDVVLMVILSSMLGRLSFKKPSSSLKYIGSRVKRLVIPTWIFLTLYFSACAVLTGELHDVRFYIDSYCLTRYGFGYVWIILIYIYCALMTPVFSKVKSPIKGLAFVLAAYVLYEVMFYFKVGTENRFVDTTFYYIIPYGLISYVGYNYSEMKKKAKLAVLFSSFAAFALMGIYYRYTTGSFQLTGIAKYPPRLYYIGYGIFCSVALLMICEKFKLKASESKPIRYISTHSMWIYLWHILYLKVYSELGFPNLWYLKLIFVYALSLLTVLAVNKILDVIGKKLNPGFFRYLRC